jgi:hypothetical protein
MIFYDTTVKVKRQKTTSGNKRGFVATATGQASIQPVAKEPTSLTDGSYGTSYVAYVEIDLPAREGDQVVDPNGVVYVVKEAVRREDTPFPHQVLTVTKQTQ